MGGLLGGGGGGGGGVCGAVERCVGEEVWRCVRGADVVFARIQYAEGLQCSAAPVWRPRATVTVKSAAVRGRGAPRNRNMWGDWWLYIQFQPTELAEGMATTALFRGLSLYTPSLSPTHPRTHYVYDLKFSTCSPSWISEVGLFAYLRMAKGAAADCMLQKAGG